MSLGLEHGQNRLAAYSSEWPLLFKSESQRILDVCGEHLLAIEHVGSTSIPGLAAKPIVDVAAGVTTLDVAEKMILGMQSIGYDYPGDIGIPDDRIFGRDPDIRRFLVHIVVFESQQWKRYIKFRELLRNDQRLRDEYQQLKTEIVTNHPTGRAEYTRLKSGFILQTLERQ